MPPAEDVATALCADVIAREMVAGLQNVPFKIACLAVVYATADLLAIHCSEDPKKLREGFKLLHRVARDRVNSTTQQIAMVQSRTETKQ